MADAAEASAEELGVALLDALDEEDSDDEVFSPAGAHPSRRPAAAHEPETARAPATSDARHPPRAPVSSRVSPGNSQLDGLPSEVLLKVLSFLSASDLVNCCTVSRALAAAAASRSPGADQLWRRLFRARWGRNTEMPGPSARRAYFDRDQREVGDLIKTVPDFLRPFYVQMAQSKRCQCLGRDHQDEGAAAEQHSSPAVADWRRRRGFRGAFALSATHACAQPTFCHVAEAFLCESCGWAHVCDDTCRERFLDGESYVCPISGYSSSRLVTDWEEIGAAAARGDDAAEDGAELGGGRLARAYVDGYFAQDEAELRRVCFTSF